MDKLSVFVYALPLILLWIVGIKCVSCGKNERKIIQRGRKLREK